MEALSLYRQAGEGSSSRRALHKLGHLENDLGRTDEARYLYRQALEVARSEGDLIAIAHELRHLGDLHRNTGCKLEAESYYREAIEIYRQHPSPPVGDLANALLAYASLEEDSSKPAAAAALLKEARELYRRLDVEDGITDCSERLARIEASLPAPLPKSTLD